MSKNLHHRSHERLQQYWEKLRKGRPYPQESEIDPDELADIWPSCFLISIDDVTRRLGYRYSYLGNDLVEAYGDDVALCLLSTASMPMTHRFDEVLKEKKPLFDESEFVNLKHLNVRYRTCMLPLGHPDNEVSHILGCMRWKLY